MTRHLHTRANELLSLKADKADSKKTSVKDHILMCEERKLINLNVNDFKVIKKCKSEYETKIHETLVIKKQNLKLNSHLHASGSSLLLIVF